MNEQQTNQTCPKCNANIKSNSKFCPNCGTNLEEQTPQITTRQCPNCKTEIPVQNKFCSKCGQNLDVIETIDNNLQVNGLDESKFMYFNLSEEQILTTMIENELKANNETNKFSTPALEKKKNIFTIAYGIIMFICLCLYYFHTARGIIYTIMALSTIIYFCLVKNYNIAKFIKKEVKARPDEKISYIVASIVSGKINNSFQKTMRIIGLALVFVLPIFIFFEPHIIYERQADDYVIRFYTLGSIKNDKILEISSTYKGRNVVGIRGDVFSNVNTIEEVILPDTIVEIRGEAFMNAKRLKRINLPPKITEVKGSTFEGCSQLEEIDIPEGVTRIGGSAFRDCYSLKTATIPATVREIRSSAFRNTALTKVCYSSSAYVDSRAFKDVYGLRRYYHENNCEGEYSNYYE